MSKPRIKIEVLEGPPNGLILINVIYFPFDPPYTILIYFSIVIVTINLLSISESHIHSNLHGV